MNTCDGCKHWIQPTGSDNSPLGSCESPKFIKGYHYEDVEALPDGVRVENDEGWGFVTAPKFGCVHWEAKS